MFSFEPLDRDVKKTTAKDPYELIITAIERGDYRPGMRMVEADLAEQFGTSRTPIREALQRLETQAFLKRDGRSLIISTLDHNQVSELYAVRIELEGLAAFLAAQHAAPEEIRVLHQMVTKDREIVDHPEQLLKANRRFHSQLHLASRNQFLISQLQQVHRKMALLANTSLAADGRGQESLDEHGEIVSAIEARDGEAARIALKRHLSFAFETRLKIDAGELKTSG